MAYISINGDFLTEEKAKISGNDRGFRYGDGIFETIAVHEKILYQWENHLKRLNSGLKELHIPAEINNLKALCDTLIEKNNLNDGFLRIIITRGNKSMGYLPAKDCTPNIYIETQPSIEVPQHPIALWLSKKHKTPDTVLPSHVKSLQGLNSTLARMEAQDHDCFEALLLGISQQVCECSSGNIFWISNDTLYTPSISCGILPGTTRDAIIRISPLPVKEAIFALADLEKAEEVFISNVAWQVLPVKSLLPKDINWSKHEKTHELHDLLKQDINAYVAARKESLG